MGRSLINYRWSNFKNSNRKGGDRREVSEMTGMVAALKASTV